MNTERTPIKFIEELDGLSIKDTKNMPHPVELTRWREAGLYYNDLERGVFRLTDKGRAVAGK